MNVAAETPVETKPSPRAGRFQPTSEMVMFNFAVNAVSRSWNTKKKCDICWVPYQRFANFVSTSESYTHLVSVRSFGFPVCSVNGLTVCRVGIKVHMAIFSLLIEYFIYGFK